MKFLNIISLPPNRFDGAHPQRTSSDGLRINLALRQLFEHKRIKVIFGVALSFLVLISSFSPSVSAVSESDSMRDKDISLALSNFKTESSLRIPLATIRLTQRFSSYHPAIDLAAPYGKSVYPFKKGKIEAVVFDKAGFGNHVIIDHGSGFKSLYAHLSKIEVSIGDQVNISQEIGKVGATGRAFGNHLHLEIYEDGKPIDPFLILPFKYTN